MARELTASQTIAIEWLSLPNKGGKTYEEIAELCEVHPNTIGNWRKDPFFDREFKRAIIRNNSGKLPEMIRALAESAIKDGNAAAGKLILQVNEMLTDRVELDTNNTDKTDIEALKERLSAFNTEKAGR